MEILKTGRIWDLLLFSIFLGLTLYFLDRASKGKSLPRIRSIAALEAIREGVGRAVEIRKPVHYSFGPYGAIISGADVSQTVASLGILQYTAGLAARLGARFIFHLPSQPYAIPLLEGAIDEAFLKEGKTEDFDKGRDLRFYGTGSMVFASAMASSFMNDGVAINVMVGRQYTIIYPALEAAKIQGAINIGGTARWTAMYIFALTCDYIFIGEEIYAAGAKVTENPYMTASIAAEENLKYVFLAILIIGLILSVAGVNIPAIFSV